MQLVLIVSVLNLLLSPRLGNIYLNTNILVPFLRNSGKKCLSLFLHFFFGSVPLFVFVLSDFEAFTGSIALNILLDMSFTDECLNAT